VPVDIILTGGPETFFKEGKMSLFSITYQNHLVSLPSAAARRRNYALPEGISRLLTLGAIMASLLLVAMAAVSVIELRPVPISPGIRSVDNKPSPRFVRALNTLHNGDLSLSGAITEKGGEDYSGRM